MKKWQKNLSITVASVLLTVSLAGCGGKAEPASGKDQKKLPSELAQMLFHLVMLTREITKPKVLTSILQQLS